MCRWKERKLHTKVGSNECPWIMRVSPKKQQWSWERASEKKIRNDQWILPDITYKAQGPHGYEWLFDNENVVQSVKVWRVSFISGKKILEDGSYRWLFRLFEGAKEFSVNYISSSIKILMRTKMYEKIDTGF